MGGRVEGGTERGIKGGERWAENRWRDGGGWMVERGVSGVQRDRWADGEGLEGGHCKWVTTECE